MSVFEGKYFTAELMEKKPRTMVYGIRSKHHGDLIGLVKWYFPWRQYCTFPEPNTVWTRSCHKEVDAFIDGLMEARKK
jgi:hypothetical protein